MEWEFSLLNWIQTSLRTPWLDQVVPVFSALWDWGAPWFLLTAGLLLYKPTRKLGWCALCALLVEVAVVSLGLKPLFQRARPCDFYPEMLTLTSRPHTASFPSGHTAQAFALCGALYTCRSKWFWPVCGLAVLLGLSRLYLYVHFPTDVLAGALIGWLCGWLGVQLCRRAQNL